MAVNDAVGHAYRVALAHGEIMGPGLRGEVSALAQQAGRIFVLGMHRGDPADPGCWTGLLTIAPDGASFSIHETRFAEPVSARRFREDLIALTGGDQASLIYSDRARRCMVEGLQAAGLLLAEHLDCSPEAVLACVAGHGSEDPDEHGLSPSP